jgi:hypothetical protein
MNIWPSKPAALMENQTWKSFQSNEISNSNHSNRSLEKRLAWVNDSAPKVHPNNNKNDSHGSMIARQRFIPTTSMTLCSGVQLKGCSSPFSSWSEPVPTSAWAPLAHELVLFPTLSLWVGGTERLDTCQPTVFSAVCYHGTGTCTKHRCMHKPPMHAPAYI